MVRLVGIGTTENITTVPIGITVTLIERYISYAYMSICLLPFRV